MRHGLKLVVVPNDPIGLYEQAGYDALHDYFNPAGMFAEVTALSPLEEGERDAFGMRVRGVAARNFKRTLASIGPDVVRAYAGDWPADLVCGNRLRGVPVVVSVHDQRRARMHASLRYADLVICTSQAVADGVAAVGVDRDRIRVLPNRVDTKQFRRITDVRKLDEIARRFPPGRHVLHIGRKVEEKNLDTVIRALALLSTDYSCVFIGLGDTSPYVRLAEELRVDDRCFWVDAVRNAELPAWYSWCDCFCVPSRSEGFGTVFIEAAACGAAIVTSDIDPMNRYLTADQSACLVQDYTDAARVAEAIRRVSENLAYRERISQGAVAVSRKFDKALVDAAEAAVYREALAVPPLPLRRRMEMARWRMRGAWAASVPRLAWRAGG